MLFGAEHFLEGNASAVSAETAKFHKDNIRPKMKAARAARRDVASALTREPFEAKALDSALAELRKRTDESQAALHEALVDLASRLSVEERKKLLDAHPGAFRGDRDGKPGPRPRFRGEPRPDGPPGSDDPPPADMAPHPADHEHPLGTSPHEH
jgi:hypothetical protein